MKPTIRKHGNGVMIGDVYVGQMPKEWLEEQRKRQSLPLTEKTCDYISGIFPTKELAEQKVKTFYYKYRKEVTKHGDNYFETKIGKHVGHYGDKVEKGWAVFVRKQRKK